MLSFTTCRDTTRQSLILEGNSGLECICLRVVRSPPRKPVEIYVSLCQGQGSGVEQGECSEWTVSASLEQALYLDQAECLIALELAWHIMIMSISRKHYIWRAVIMLELKSISPGHNHNHLLLIIDLTETACWLAG